MAPHTADEAAKERRHLTLPVCFSVEQCAKGRDLRDPLIVERPAGAHLGNCGFFFNGAKP
jgi:hypothetical protein